MVDGFVKATKGIVCVGCFFIAGLLRCFAPHAIVGVGSDVAHRIGFLNQAKGAVFVGGGTKWCGLGEFSIEEIVGVGGDDAILIGVGEHVAMDIVGEVFGCVIGMANGEWFLVNSVGDLGFVAVWIDDGFWQGACCEACLGDGRLGGGWSRFLNTVSKGIKCVVGGVSKVVGVCDAL